MKLLIKFCFYAFDRLKFFVRLLIVFQTVRWHFIELMELKNVHVHMILLSAKLFESSLVKGSTPPITKKTFTFVPLRNLEARRLQVSDRQ